LYDIENADSIVSFDFRIIFELNGVSVKIENSSGNIQINDSAVKSIDLKLLPEKVILYYSGHNGTIASFIGRYETTFKRKIKRAKISDSRAIVSIGNDYKQILLSTIFLQPDSSKAKKYILEKLKIKDMAPWFKIGLKKPFYAKADIEIDEGEERFWGAEGVVRDFLNKLLKCFHENKSERARTEGFIQTSQKYQFYIDVNKFREEFASYSISDLFNQFDNLKTLEMLDEILLPISIESGSVANTSYFSDGQFQSVYMYAVAEIFKGKNCLTLLDEPDAFLHPEWQFFFIDQVADIADDVGKSNHLIMSSHSASTVSRAEQKALRLFDFDGSKVAVTQVSKFQIIQSLSAGLISFSEEEANLSINHVLKGTSGPVLFTEGITDEIILEKAWAKLFKQKKRDFVIQNAYDRIFLRNLFSRDELRANYPKRKMFALFDFDDAYNDWSGLKEKAHLVVDPFKGLTKQLSHEDHFAMLLPVPANELVKKQVLDSNNKPWGSGQCHLSMELLFYSDDLLGKHYKKLDITGGGQLITFTGDKAKFANDIVGDFPVDKFEIFRPIFEFIIESANLK
jgi:ABC-type cobalamin/Fe3+-siderophores transport system ATPase subunit